MQTVGYTSSLAIDDWVYLFISNPFVTVTFSTPLRPFFSVLNVTYSSAKSQWAILLRFLITTAAICMYLNGQ